MAIGMQRREFITLPSGAAATWPVSVRAQQPTMALVGLLAGQQLDDRRLDAVRQGLKEAGYIEGCNLAISIARPMVASTDYGHWSPRWWPIRWPSSLRSTQRLQSQPKLQPRPFRSYSRQAPIRSNSVWFPARAARQGTVEFADTDQIQYSARSMQLESRSNELSDSFVCLSPMCEHC